MNNNLKALLARGLKAVKELEKSRDNCGKAVNDLAKNQNTQRALVSYFGSVTPKGLDAAVRAVEAMGALYDEAALKVHILNQAMPGIAESIEAANDGEGCVSAFELIAAGKELEEEEETPRNRKTRRAPTAVRSEEN